MVVTSFPPSHLADENGLLAIGGDVDLETLLLAYRSGIFPWPLEGEVLTWFAPPVRAILEIDQFILSRSMRRFLKRHDLEIFLNRDFESTIIACQQSTNRDGQLGTWITDDLIEGYLRLHEAGYAHSVECYDGRQLVGGLYGVSLGVMFAGESMFHIRNNASKLCFCFLVSYLRSHSVSWIDCQVMTPLTASFGAHEVQRTEFEEMLRFQLSQSQSRIFPIEPKEIGVWRGDYSVGSFN